MTKKRHARTDQVGPETGGELQTGEAGTGKTEAPTDDQTSLPEGNSHVKTPRKQSAKKTGVEASPGEENHATAIVSGRNRRTKAKDGSKSRRTALASLPSNQPEAKKSEPENASRVSDVLRPFAEAVRDLVTDDKRGAVIIGQRQTTVFLKHPDLKRQIVTFYGSENSVGLFSPFLNVEKDEGAWTDTLGLVNFRVKPATVEGVRAIGKKILERAGLTGQVARVAPKAGEES